MYLISTTHPMAAGSVRYFHITKSRDRCVELGDVAEVPPSVPSGGFMGDYTGTGDSNLEWDVCVVYGPIDGQLLDCESVHDARPARVYYADVLAYTSMAAVKMILDREEQVYAATVQQLPPDDR